MADLGDRWRLVAPDLPGLGFGFGYSDAAAPGTYGFAGYGEFLRRFAEALGLQRYALYLHDYADAYGPEYDALKRFWADPTPAGREAMARNVSEDAARAYLRDLPEAELHLLDGGH